MKKRPPVIDENGKKRFINPDITGGIGMYTANKSWLAGAFRSATLVKPKILYRGFAAYGDMNLSFYANNLPNRKDEEFKLNFKSTIFYTQWLKQFNNAKWSAGPQYLFLNSKINLPDFNLPPPFVDPKDIKSTISQLGAALQFDGRDNIFTPDKGVRLQTDFFWSDKALGSDYQAWRINLSAIGYYPLAKTLIGGLRIEGSRRWVVRLFIYSQELICEEFPPPDIWETRALSQNLNLDGICTEDGVSWVLVVWPVPLTIGIRLLPNPLCTATELVLDISLPENLNFVWV